MIFMNRRIVEDIASNATISYYGIMSAFKWLAVSVILLISIWWIRDLIPIAKTTWTLKQENAALARELAARNREKQALEAQLREFAEPRRIEEEAKLRLQVRRPGEEVVIIIPPEESSTTTPPAGDKKEEGVLNLIVRVLGRLLGGE